MCVSLNIECDIQIHVISLMRIQNFGASGLVFQTNSKLQFKQSQLNCALKRKGCRTIEPESILELPRWHEAISPFIFTAAQWRGHEGGAWPPSLG